jgi:hypothetical protein
MPEHGVPAPGTLLTVGGQANRLCNDDVDHIKPIHGTPHPGQQSPAWLTDAHHPLLDGDIVPHLVELSHANNVGREAGYVVHTSELSVFSILALEED